MYHFPELVECMDSLFYATHIYVNTRDIFKHWMKEISKFRQTPTHVYKTKSLRKSYQLLVIFAYKIHGSQSMETFLEGWEFLLEHVVNEGKSLNLSDLLAQQLKSHVA